MTDPEFGWRLHFADLSVNKVLAAASRRQARDFVDLYLDIDHFVIERMIDRYGRNGERLWAAEPTRPAAAGS